VRDRALTAQVVTRSCRASWTGRLPGSPQASRGADASPSRRHPWRPRRGCYTSRTRVRGFIVERARSSRAVAIENASSIRSTRILPSQRNAPTVPLPTLSERSRKSIRASPASKRRKSDGSRPPFFSGVRLNDAANVQGLQSDAEAYALGAEGMDPSERDADGWRSAEVEQPVPGLWTIEVAPMDTIAEQARAARAQGLKRSSRRHPVQARPHRRAIHQWWLLPRMSCLPQQRAYRHARRAARILDQDMRGCLECRTGRTI